MKGMVKFYNKEKGFGFVVSENNQNYYFNHEVIPFGHMPNSGDMVEFEVSDQPTSNKHKEPTIAKMTLTGEQATGTNAQNPNDNRVECPHCHKKVLPRIVTHYGRADRSLCPFCGNVVAEFVHTYLIKRLVITFVVVSAILIAMAIFGRTEGLAFLPMCFLAFLVIWTVFSKPGKKNKVKVDSVW